MPGMRSVGDWLRDVPGLPPAAAIGPDLDYEIPQFHLLGADLPLGHLHVWAGPPRSGTTAILLGLLHAAARHGRVAALASYDLAGPSVALRCLAMASGVPLDDLEAGRFSPEAALRTARARASLDALPLHVVEARGMGVTSIEDRVVRLPYRVGVLGVDSLQAVVRPAGRGAGDALRDLAALASRLHVAVVCASRSEERVPVTAPARDASADRVGWLAPPDANGACEASARSQRGGHEVACRLRLDRDSARLVPPA
jgi:hypothetical protein